jgi:hypothetical protein
MKHISSFISQSSLKSQTSNDWLVSTWQRSAPPALQQICHPKKYHENCLTLQVDSSVWLSRVRQQQKSLIRLLRLSREFAGIRKIKLEVSPRKTTNSQNTSKHYHRKLSGSNKKNLLSTAEHISDPELRLSLQRLAETASKP